VRISSAICVMDESLASRLIAANSIGGRDYNRADVKHNPDHGYGVLRRAVMTSTKSLQDIMAAIERHLSSELRN
jgi:hypothetical protein